jgi:hypothetical protein
VSRFLSVPALIKVAEASSGGRARWRTQGELIYLDAKGRTWTVPAGYITDFASVPRLPLMYWLTGDTAHMSAVLHDYLCTDFVPELMSWREAADLFREAMQAEGTPGWRRWGMYWAVRLFGSEKKEE